MEGKKHSDITKRKMRLAALGKRNHNWKGDAVGYHALHGWIKTQLIKPQTCRDCNQQKKLDLANISGEYKRDLSDWEWLCRSCHMKKDGRIEKLHKLYPIGEKKVWLGKSRREYNQKNRNK